LKTLSTFSFLGLLFSLFLAIKTIINIIITILVMSFFLTILSQTTSSYSSSTITELLPDYLFNSLSPT
jgi:hypothetical protein